MRRDLTIALRLTVVTLLLTGLLYPLAVTGAAQLLFPHRANGSLTIGGKDVIVGSEMLGQTFTMSAYLQGRPSMAGTGYDASSSSGSNLGPTSKKLRDRVAGDVARLGRENPGASAPVPDALVTTSASGLDPDIPPAAALWQVPRIAEARQVARDRVSAVILARVKGRDLGVFGEPRVNVLEANLALDRKFGAPALSLAPAARVAPVHGASPAGTAPLSP